MQSTAVRYELTWVYNWKCQVETIGLAKPNHFKEIWLDLFWWVYNWKCWVETICPAEPNNHQSLPRHLPVRYELTQVYNWNARWKQYGQLSQIISRKSGQTYFGGFTIGRSLHSPTHSDRTRSSPIRLNQTFNWLEHQQFFKSESDQV